MFLCRVQLEESEFTCAAAVKSRKSMEVEIEDLHVQMEDISKTKQAVSTASRDLDPFPLPKPHFIFHLNATTGGNLDLLYGQVYCMSSLNGREKLRLSPHLEMIIEGVHIGLALQAFYEAVPSVVVGGWQ